MKKTILYVFASILIAVSVSAAPGSKILKRFSETFPNAQNIKWTDDTNGYFVSFSQNGAFLKALYNKDGNFLYTLKYSDGSALPTNIVMTLNEKYGETKIIGTTEITMPDKTIYNIKLSKDDKLYCLNILTDGSVVKEEEYSNGTN